jgi:hypothetical protein
LFLKKCQSPILDIASRTPLFNKPANKKISDLFSLIGIATINCNASLTNQKQWFIYSTDSTGIDQQQITLSTNPTINYAELVLQPKTFTTGLYRFVYTLTMIIPDGTTLTSEIDTFVSIIPSGLVLSTLSQSQPMYGGLIEISRGHAQSILFNPFLNTYDIDSIAVITSLTFKYSCQVIDSNVKQGYPVIPSTNQTVYLDQIKQNTNLITYNTCFGNTLNLISFDSTLNRLTLNQGSLLYVPNRQYEIYVSTVFYNIEYYQKVLINILPPPKLPIPIITY